MGSCTKAKLTESREPIDHTLAKPTASSPLQEKRTYLKASFVKGGASIAEGIVKDGTFRSALIKAMESFDAEDPIIRFSDILKTPSLRGSVNTAAIEKCVAAFSDLEGKDWEPAIRLHRPAKQVNVVALQSGVPTDVFAIDEGWPEGTQPEVQGWQEVNGELWPIDDFWITEDFVEAHPVWVFELTPPVDQQDIGLTQPPSQSCLWSWEPSFAGQIQRIRIKQRKEHWLGASEIHISRLTTWNQAPASVVVNGTEHWPIGKPNKYKEKVNGRDIYHCVYDAEGNPLTRYRRVHIGDLRNLNFDLIKSWRPQTGSEKDLFTFATCLQQYCVIRGNRMFYVIFEHDVWPARRNKAKIIPTTGPAMEIEYRSWESSYSEGWIEYVHPSNPATPTNIKGFTVSNGDIDFNTAIKL